jgi:hypothetical protein
MLVVSNTGKVYYFPHRSTALEEPGKAKLLNLEEVPKLAVPPFTPLFAVLNYICFTIIILFKYFLLPFEYFVNLYFSHACRVKYWKSL